MTPQTQPLLLSGVGISQALLSFTVASALLTITPGIDTALVLRTATVKGQREAFGVVGGTGAGCFIWCILVSLGLGALLLVSEVIYDALRVAGACYLLYLGAQMILKSRSHSLNTDSVDLHGEARGHSGQKNWFYQGFFNNLLNPKVGVFYVTFLPQFIPQGADISTFGLLLGAIHVFESILWFSLLTLATRPLSQWLKRPGVIARLDQLTGSILIFFGLKLILEPRHAR